MSLTVLHTEPPKAWVGISDNETREPRGVHHYVGIKGAMAMSLCTGYEINQR